MFSQNGLSLDQAPPISVVFGFFFLGALFGILSGVLIFIYKTDIFDISSVGALTFTHTLTLGVMLSFMFAALFQMLPVIAGVTLTSPIKKSNLVKYPFGLGTLLLLSAFNLPDASWLFIVASTLLGGSILSIVFIMIKNLLALPNHSASSRGMLTALLALALLIFFALYLTFTRGGIVEGSYYMQVKEAHYSFGLFGWIALLIISISFQVIEMFYVTPPYPKLVSRYLPLILIALLFVSSLTGLFYSSVWIVSDILIALLFSGYALLTLKRLTQRKRPLTDATVWFWRMGLGSLVLSMLLMSISLFIELPTLKILSYILFVSFALSIVFAMFYKIIPFLTWFHLNSQGYFTAPMMHEVIHPKTAKKHLWIHLTAVITFILSIFIPSLITVAGVLTITSFGWMGYQIIHANLLYKKTQESGEKFDMNMGNY